MLLATRQTSSLVAGAALALAAVAFLVGLGVGGMLGPLRTSREAVSTQTYRPVAEPRPIEPSAMRVAYVAQVLRVLDGDTFEARVRVWPGFDVTTRVRLRGIDAPEMSARCGEERLKAEAARDALKAILDQGGVGITRVTLDKYGGRVLADASTYGTPDVSAAMLDAGLARRYAGARRESWC